MYSRYGRTNVLLLKFSTSIRKISVSMLPKVESMVLEYRPEFAHAGPLRIWTGLRSDRDWCHGRTKFSSSTIIVCDFSKLIILNLVVELTVALAVAGLATLVYLLFAVAMALCSPRTPPGTANQVGSPPFIPTSVF